MEGLLAKYGAQKAYVAHTNCPELLPICPAVAVSLPVTISAPSAPFIFLFIYSLSVFNLSL